MDEFGPPGVQVDERAHGRRCVVLSQLDAGRIELSIDQVERGEPVDHVVDALVGARAFLDQILATHAELPS